MKGKICEVFEKGASAKNIKEIDKDFDISSLRKKKLQKTEQITKLEKKIKRLTNCTIILLLWATIITFFFLSSQAKLNDYEQKVVLPEIDSIILSDKYGLSDDLRKEQVVFLNEVLNIPVRVERLFRASEHNFKAAKFH